jgi:hypothetical protein
MKKRQLAVIFTSGLLFFSGMSQAQENNASVTKTISITATIGDSIFVSRPQGGGWYQTVDLAANDGTQQSFASSIPVQVWSSTPEFNVSLVHPLEIVRTDSAYIMDGVKVRFADAGGKGKDLGTSGVVQTFNQKAKVGNGYQSVYQLNVNAHAPKSNGNADTQGLYTGEMVMLFEIAASSI